jgi:hypothetical protein
MRRLTVFPLIIQPGNTFPDHVQIVHVCILVWKSNRQFQKYATTVPSGRFSDNKQYNPVQQGIGWVMISLWMGNTMASLDKSLVMIQMSSTVVRFLL